MAPAQTGDTDRGEAPGRDTGETGVLPSFDGFLQYGEGWKLLNLDEL